MSSSAGIKKDNIFCIALRLLVFLGMSLDGALDEEFDKFPFLNYTPEDCRAFLDWLKVTQFHLTSNQWKQIKTRMDKNELTLYTR